MKMCIRDSLSDVCIGYTGLRTDILRQGGYIFGIDLPGRVIKIQLIVRAEKIHVCFPKGINGTNILPVAFEAISKQALSVV